MSNKSLRIIVVLAVLCTAWVIVNQFFWIKKAVELEKNIFNSNVTIALKNVAVQLLKMNKNNSPVDSIVSKVEDKYYTVQINDKIDTVVLKHILKRELLAQQIKTDYTISVFDCENSNMIYTEYISYSNTDPSDMPLPSVYSKNKKSNNYFSVYFPHLKDFLTREMATWIVSSLVLVLFLFILSYTIFIIFRQKRLSEIQKDFVNNMTHEFKTPLATIKISSEVLKNPNIIQNPERLLNYATIISNETIHLTHQVERVLQMAKSGKDSIQLNKEEFSLSPLLQEIIDKTYKPLIRSRGGDIVVQMSSEETKIYADRLHMKNVIGNILDNAIKYCTDTPNIQIRTTENKDGVNIFIKDNGIGISKENLKNIFNKFYRIPTGNLHDVKGFGLGLNYVKIICRQHGGDIKVTSELDKGSEFCIFIPKK
ncbi:MAG: HAMP domain-containing histidine kinase [Chitinophagaceae bacterium]|nr:HAMP domain-containing histidine kinase [Chitinophagaceae bacterium]